MGRTRRLCSSAAAASASLLIVACGTVQVSSADDEPCIVSTIYDYELEGAGAATPAAALEAKADGIDAVLEKELTTIPDTPERRLVHGRDHASAAALRSLVEPAEQDPGAGRWEVRDEDGTVTARVHVEEARDGGWRISTLGHVAPPENCEGAEERHERVNPS